MNTQLTVLDNYLSAKEEVGQLTFTQAELVEVLSLEPASATTLIQEYLRVQSSKTGTNLTNLIYRVPGTRTTRAVWTFGDRSKDVRKVVAQATSDFQTRADFLADFLASVKVSNPNAARAIAKAVTLLAVAIQTLEEGV